MNANRNLFFVFGEKKNLKVKRSKSLPKNKPLLPKQEGALPGALFPLAMHCSPVQLWEFRSSLCVSRSKKILSFLQGGKMPNKKLIVFFLQSFYSNLVCSLKQRLSQGFKDSRRPKLKPMGQFFKLLF